MGRNTDHLAEAKLMLYDNPAVAQAHALIVVAQELAGIRMGIFDIAERAVARGEERIYG